jgi:G protein-coupled receptor 31
MVALTHQGLFGPKTAQNSTDCPSFYPTRESSASATWQEMFFFFQFLLPFGLILFCNTSLIRILQKRLRESHKQPRLQRAKALVTVVLLLFVLCFLPSILARALVHIFRGSQSCPVWRKMVHTSDIAGSLTCLHSALNPAVYCFSNPAFTHSYRKVLSSLRGRRKAVEPPSSDLRDSYS